MPDLIDLLSRFNRKERFFLIRQALGHEWGAKGFTLSPGFRGSLRDAIDAIKVEVPDTAVAWMDYHLDWIAASLWAYQHPELACSPIPKSENVATGTQQDIDLLIAFKAGDGYCLVLLEAKGYDAWSNQQLAEKAQRLKEIFGREGTKYRSVKPYFCLTSSGEPSAGLHGCGAMAKTPTG